MRTADRLHKLSSSDLDNPDNIVAIGRCYLDLDKIRKHFVKTEQVFEKRAC